MRSAPPQPGNYLGDDPDLTADLGQRLAATAQTGQGLITNYLFYGQRRAAEQQLTDREDRDAERWQEQSADSARAGDRHPVADAARRTRDHLNRAPHPAGHTHRVDRDRRAGRDGAQDLPDRRPAGRRVAHRFSAP